MLTGEDIYLKEAFMQLIDIGAVDMIHSDLATSPQGNVRTVEFDGLVGDGIPARYGRRLGPGQITTETRHHA